MLIPLPIVGFILGGILGYVFYDFSLRKKKALYTIITAVRKKQPLAFLETDKAVFVDRIVKVYKGLAITPRKDILILTRNSPKPAIGLGIQIFHGDAYKGVAVPQEVRKIIQELLSGKYGTKWKPEDIAQFFEEIEKNPAEWLEEFYKYMKENETKIVKTEKGEEEIPASEIDKKKYDIFIGMPSVVKDFIYTGLNRTMIKAMLREMVYQRELEKIKTWNWLYIAIAILIILIGLGFFLPKILPYLTAAAPKPPPTPPARIVP